MTLRAVAMGFCIFAADVESAWQPQGAGWEGGAWETVRAALECGDGSPHSKALRGTKLLGERGAVTRP